MTSRRHSLPIATSLLSALFAAPAPGAEPKASWEAHEATVNRVAFSPDGRLLATASEDATIKLWDPASHKLVKALKNHPTKDGDTKIVGVQGMAFSPDGKTLASIGGDNQLKMWNVATGKARKPLAEVRYAWGVAFSPDGRWLATAGDVGEPGTALGLFDAKSSKRAKVVTDEAFDVFAVAFSPDSKLVAVGGKQGKVLLVDPKVGKVARRIETDATTTIMAVSFDRDGGTQACVGIVEPFVRLLDPKTGREVGRLQDGEDGIQSLRFAPDGKRLAAGTRGGAVKVWEVAGRKIVATFEGHEDQVRAVAFSPDGKTLASADKGGVVKLWDVSK
jgi:WD40 repeat protein